MDKQLLAILALGLSVVFAPIVGVASPWESRANATNSVNANAVLDPNNPPLVTTPPFAGAAAPGTAAPAGNDAFWQNIKTFSVDGMTKATDEFFKANSGGGMIQNAVQGAVQGAVKNAITAAGSLFGGGGAKGSVNSDNISKTAQQQTIATGQQGAKDAVDNMSKAPSSEAVDAAARLLADGGTPGSVAEAVDYANGVDVAASNAERNNPGLGNSSAMSKVEAQKANYISRSVLDPGAVAKQTGDVATNTANALATQNATDSVVGTNAADSSLDELGNIKKIVEVNADTNAKIAIGIAKLTEGNMNSNLLTASSLALASSEANRQAQKQSEEESQRDRMIIRGIQTKGLLASIGSGGATSVSTSGLQP
jgi:hypothetical protein